MDIRKEPSRSLQREWPVQSKKHGWLGNKVELTHWIRGPDKTRLTGYKGHPHEISEDALDLGRKGEHSKGLRLWINLMRFMF
jgi:hypothetical protein